MIDVKVIRENPDLVRASQKARGESVELVDQVLAADEVIRYLSSKNAWHSFVYLPFPEILPDFTASSIYCVSFPVK